MRHWVFTFGHGQRLRSTSERAGGGQLCDDTVDGVRVSTVFLGLDDSHRGVGPPVLFESMVFGGPWDQERCRYTSAAQARAGHAVIVAALREGLAQSPIRELVS